MNGQIRIEHRGAARAAADALRVVRDRRAHGVMVDAEGGGDGADLPVLAEIEAANLGVLLGRDHGASPGTRDGSGQGGGRSQALSRPQTIQRNAPTRGAVGTGSVDVSAGSVASGAGAAGSLIPHAGAIRALMIAMIEAAFGTAPMALARGADRSPARGRATRRRAIRVAAITRRRRSQRGGCSADRFSGEAACPRRRSGGALRLDTARQTVAQERRLARSVGASRRSPRVWRFKLQALTSSATAVSLRDRTPTPKPQRPWTLPHLWTHRRAHSCLENRADAVSHERPPPFSFLSEERRTNYRDDVGPDLRGFR